MITGGKNRKIISILGAAAILAGLILWAACFAQAATSQSVSPLGNSDVDKNETAIGDLAADSLRAMTKADVAFVAASELKPKSTPIPAGKVSGSDFSDLVSYSDDPLAVMRLSGAQIQQALEKAVSIYPQPNLGFMQVSGIKFTFSASAESGSRIKSITFNGSPMDPAGSYTVAVTNSMANGALGYWKVWSKDNVVQRLQDATLVKAINDYLANNASINYGTLDRISAK